MQIMLITLSYAEAANNLQIILTIRLTPLKMDELLWFDKIIKIYQPLLKKTDWQIPSASPYYFNYRFNKLPTYRNSSFADVEL